MIHSNKFESEKINVFVIQYFFFMKTSIFLQNEKKPFKIIRDCVINFEKTYNHSTSLGKTGPISTENVLFSI